MKKINNNDFKTLSQLLKKSDLPLLIYVLDSGFDMLLLIAEKQENSYHMFKIYLKSPRFTNNRSIKDFIYCETWCNLYKEIPNINFFENYGFYTNHKTYKNLVYTMKESACVCYNLSEHDMKNLMLIIKKLKKEK